MFHDGLTIICWSKRQIDAKHVVKAIDAKHAEDKNESDDTYIYGCIGKHSLKGILD